MLKTRFTKPTVEGSRITSAEVIDRCLKKRKGERMDSARGLAEALERLGAARDTPAPA